MGLRALATRHALDDAAVRKLRVLWERLADDAHVPSAVRGRADVLERHIADSLVGLELAEVRGSTAIADIGAGAGLPGLVLAATLPFAKVVELESQQRKAGYIDSLALAAGIANARVVAERAEEWQEGVGAHDLVTARALAPQPVALEYAAPLLRIGGFVVEWRGRREPQDEQAGDAAAAELGLVRRAVHAVVPFESARDRHLHVFEKVSATPARFPRRAGVASRRPLGR